MLAEGRGVQGQGSTTSTKIGKPRVHLEFPNKTIIKNLLDLL